MEKNLNKVRHIPYGRKKVYFSDIKKVARFVNLYRSLFIKADHVRDGFFVRDFDSDKGHMYELNFLMNHDDMREIEKNIKFKRYSFIRDFDFCSPQKYVVKYYFD